MDGVDFSALGDGFERVADSDIRIRKADGVIDMVEFDKEDGTVSERIISAESGYCVRIKDEYALPPDNINRIEKNVTRMHKRIGSLERILSMKEALRARKERRMSEGR